MCSSITVVSCFSPALCNPMDCGPPSSRQEHWSGLSCPPHSSIVVVQSLSHVWLFATPWTAAWLPYPSPSPGVCSNSCPFSQWCHPTMSSSVALFSSCPQSFPASESFLTCYLFASGGQSIGASASTSILPMNTQGWFPLGLTGLISLQLYSNKNKERERM